MLVVTSLGKPLWPLGIALSSAVAVFFAHQAFVRLGEGEASARRQSAKEIERRGEAPSVAMAEPEAGRRRADVAPEGIDARDLLEASESFRNTSLLIAIRDAGFVCTDIVGAIGTDEAPAWRVSCEGALVYFVTGDEEGRLGVVPVAYGENPQSLFLPDGLNPTRDWNEQLRPQWRQQVPPEPRR